MILRLVLALLCMALVRSAADAGEARSLYSAEAVVTGTGEAERTRGFREGLAEVIVRIAGDARLASDPKLQETLRDPQRWVEWFEYEDRMKGIPIHDEQGSRDRPHFLRMRFNAALLDAELDRLGSAKWAERPAIYAWIAVRTEAGEFVLGASGPEGYGQRAALMRAAARRGLQIVLPPDGFSSSVTVADIVGERLDELRFGADPGSAVLTGVLSILQTGYWDIDWRLSHGGRSRAWTESGVTFDAAFLNGLDTTALLLSGRGPF